MPAKGLGVHHVDLAVSDVERSLAFYLELLGPLGWQVARRSSAALDTLAASARAFAGQ